MLIIWLTLFSYVELIFCAINTEDTQEVATIRLILKTQLYIGKNRLDFISKIRKLCAHHAL